MRLEEIVLIHLHEEMQKVGVLPAVSTTAFACRPAGYRRRAVLRGTDLDWMVSVYGLSTMHLWKRPEGPDVLRERLPRHVDWRWAQLRRARPLLDVGGSKTSRDRGSASPVTVPSSSLPAILQAAAEEARRARQAGCFTFVLADGEGRLLNVEGSPTELAVEWERGGWRASGTAPGRCARTPAGERSRRTRSAGAWRVLPAGSRGRLDRALQGFCGDHESTICKHPATLDAMLFDCTAREALREPRSRLFRAVEAVPV